MSDTTVTVVDAEVEESHNNSLRRKIYFGVGAIVGLVVLVSALRKKDSDEETVVIIDSDDDKDVVTTEIPDPVEG